ncbi:MAG: bifunctional chorismate mutase/prephenate dehydratase, partial [Chloroflexi bacterium]|nr:bifunctional chorismate mutase/prephenate dehydratase [Chloroflexota bacterium]
MSISVAFQGERGAFSEAAAVAFFGESVETVPCTTFDQVFAEVQSGRCDHGIAPIENSLTGSIYRIYDLLLRNELLIAGEFT